MEFPNLDSTIYAASVQGSRDELRSRLPKFKRDEIKVKLFALPCDLAVEDNPDDCQMELIELQADFDTNRGHSGNSLVAFSKINY